MTLSPGEWYRMKGSNLEFEIVCVDEDDETVEVQYKDGTVEEFQLDELEDELVKIGTPEDWDATAEEEEE